MASIDIFSKLKDGDSSNIVSEIQVTLSGQGKCDISYKVLIRISNACIKSQITLDDNELLKISQICFRSVLTDHEANLTIPCKSNVLVAAFNIFHRFQKNNRLENQVDFLECFLPVVEKMIPSMSEADTKLVNDFCRVLHNAILKSDNSIFSEKINVKNKIAPRQLWQLMLHLCSLGKIEVLLPLNIMRVMVYKCEVENSGNVDKNFSFVSHLLNDFEKFCVKVSKKILIDDMAVNKLFSTVMLTVWQCIKNFGKTNSLQNAQLILSSVTKCLNLIMPLRPGHIQCWQIFVRVYETFLFPVKSLPAKGDFVRKVEKCVEDLQQMSTSNEREAFSWACYMCANTLSSMECWDLNLPGMQEFFSLSVVTAIYRFARKVVKVVLASQCSACVSTSGAPCPVKTDFYVAFATLNRIIILCQTYHKAHSSDWKKVMNFLEASMAELYDVLSRAKEQGCIKTDFMHRSYHTNIYNLGNACYANKDWETAKKLLLEALQYTCDTMDSGNASFDSKIMFIIPALTCCYHELDLSHEIHSLILLPFVVKKQSCLRPDMFMSRTWCTVQNKLSEKTRSTTDYFLNDGALLRSLCPTIYVDDKRLKESLLWELHCLASNNVTDVALILQAWNSLKEAKPSDLELLEGQVLTFKALFAAGVSEASATHLEQLCVLDYDSVLKETPKANRKIVLGLFSIHAHVDALFKTHKHCEESEKCFEKSPNILVKPAKILEPEDVPDPNDTCVVKLAYKNLNVMREGSLMDLFETALKFLEESLVNGLCAADDAEHSWLEICGDSVVGAAFIYKLFGYHLRAAKAWGLCRKFAKLMCRDDLLLQALSGLMNTVECKPALLLEAEELSQSLSKHIKKRYLQQMYFTCRAFHALRTKNYEDGVQSLCRMIGQVPTTTSVWAYLYNKLLQALYACLPCRLVDLTALGELHGENEASTGLRYALGSIKDKTLSMSTVTYCAVADQLLSISLWLGRLYLQLKQPREARCFLKNELEVAQKLGLATRAAEFLCELAQVDVLTEKLDDAAAKVNDINLLLESEGYVESKAETIEISPRRSPRLVSKHVRNDAASPALKEPAPSMPSFAEHSLTCCCYLCENVTIQNVWVGTAHIRAKIFTFQCIPREAYNSYKLGLALVKCFRKVQLKKPALPGPLLKEHELTFMEASLLISYIDMLAIYKKDAEARKKNESVLALLHNMKTAEQYLVAEAVEQELCLIQIARDECEPTRGQNSEAEPHLYVITPEKSAPTLVKTPINSSKRRIFESGRKPLESITPNKLVQPISSQQIVTPKELVKHFNSLIFDEPDLPSEEICSKENKSSIQPRLFKTPRSELQKPVLTTANATRRRAMKENLSSHMDRKELPSLVVTCSEESENVDGTILPQAISSSSMPLKAQRRAQPSLKLGTKSKSALPKQIDFDDNSVSGTPVSDKKGSSSVEVCVSNETKDAKIVNGVEKGRSRRILQSKIPAPQVKVEPEKRVTRQRFK